MNFKEFATSAFGTRLWMGLGHLLPAKAGYTLARTVASNLGRRINSSLYQNLYTNQATILGPQATPTDVHYAVNAVLQHAGQVSYDLMHIIAKGKPAILTGIEFGPSVWADIAAARAGGHGVMLCGAHLSNFNLAFLSFAICGIKMQLLTPASPQGGYELLKDLRSRGLLVDTPIDTAALRDAIHRLRAGGVVLTGTDWPEASGEIELLPFFGQPAHLPTGHIRLALTSNARLLPIACGWEPGRGYFVQSAPPIEPVRTGHRDEDVRVNARRVLAVFEKWIAQRPEQWLMYYPVWGGLKREPEDTHPASLRLTTYPTQFKEDSMA